MARRKRRKGAKAKAAPTPLSARMMKLREASGLSRAALAELLGWSEMRVYRIETGWTRPRADDVEAWAREVGSSVAGAYGEVAA